MTKTYKTQVVKAYGKYGYNDFKTGFKTFQEADEWLCEYVRKNHLCIGDYRVVEE